MTVAQYSGLVTDRSGKGLTHGNADVFHRMVSIDMQIALGLNLQIDKAMSCDLIEHVLEKRQTGLERTFTLPVKLQDNLDLRLGRVADYFSVAHRHDDTFASMNRFWNPFLAALTPYVPGEQPRIEGLIKLNTNENPYPPSAKALDAMRAAINDSLRLYPDPSASDLKRTLAHRYCLKPEEVFVGNGSDEVLAFLFQALMGQQGGCAFPSISYSFYPVYCQLFGIDSKPFALAEDFSVALDQVPEQAACLILPNPNAPTGIALDAEAIVGHARLHPSRLVVVDEAYVDFGASSCLPYIGQLDNLMVVQTLSKSRALAGLRVGFAFGPRDLIEALERVKNSFNSYTVDRVAMAGAIAAIDDEAWFQTNISRVITNRQRLCEALHALGFEVLESKANFLFVRHPQRDAAKLASALRQRNILVRHFTKPLIDQFLRISVGDEHQCDVLVDALRSLNCAEAA